MFHLFIYYRYDTVFKSQEVYAKLSIQQAAIKWENLVIYMSY